MSRSRPVVAIDGPAGVGKSTTARMLARRLGIPYLDTGAMYRCLALGVLRQGIDPEDRAAVEAGAAGTRLELRMTDDGPELLLDGTPVGAEIRSSEVSQATSTISTYPEVRRRMVELQRRFGERHGGVIEGRDIGSVVFPATPHKFFLDADPRVRAERRHRELEARGERREAREIAAELEERDQRDRQRQDSPLVRCSDHVLIDTGELRPEQVVERIASAVCERERRTG
ncbi:MAG TPA: (d)CMP kinase [Thermoanaerobaculia bacterium]|nr:(d)CMP kinase [Thermoanaerobaculia bacterium]